MVDYSGKDLFARNLVVTWIAHGFVLATGFIVPRMISDSLGQETLGLWDLCWVAVRYLTLSRFGVGTALSRSVALNRSRNSYSLLAQSVTAVICWQLIIGIIIAFVAFYFGTAFVNWVGVSGQLDQSRAEAVFRLIILSLAVNMIVTPANALLSGYHRWDILNGLNGFHDFILAVAMVGLLYLGYGIEHLAWAVFLNSIFSALIRVVIARNVCRGDRVSLGSWSWVVAKDMLIFGVKSMLITIPSASIFQITAFLVAGNAGPGVLAILNRGLALIRHCEQVVTKLAAMFLPMTSGQLGQDEDAEAYVMIVEAVKSCFAVTLPLMLLLAACGEQLILIWMGDGYASRYLMPILALGGALPIAFSGATSVLTGLDQHGKLAIYTITIALIVYPAAALVGSQVGWGVTSGALIISVSWAAAKGVGPSLLIWKEYDESVYRQFVDMLLLVVFANIPLALLLIVARVSLLEGEFLISFLSLFAGIVATAIIYWCRLLTVGGRKALRGVLGRVFNSH